MSNKEIYSKTLTFSIRKLIIDLITLALVIGLCVLGFVLFENWMKQGIGGLIIGLIVGILIAALIGHFVSYILKAGQIAMMTYGLTENKLPENVYKEGRKVVKERFVTVAALYAVTNGIKGIFHQIGRGITAIGNAIGGDTGSTVGSAVSSAIETIVSYMCDCCLGWVFYRKDEGSVKATLEGSVLFFKHGKTLIKNVGRIFGIGLVSLLLIGGVFFGISYIIFINIPSIIKPLANKIAEIAAESEKAPQFLSNPATVVIVLAIVIGVCIWAFIHSSFIRPYVLVGVLRNYLESGMKDIPDEKSFAELKGKSNKFDKLMEKLD